ncbi:MAG: ubiquinol-cytochrome c reductase iron-sulfur subunit [Nitrospiraceae bacterium]|nr:ubiquinol-cytochrome c reductase iron-sulfur subunit [Nitrospiraceae bacterium]
MQTNPLPEKNEQSMAERRSFLKWMIGVLSAMIGLVMGIPYIRTVINSAPLRKLSYVEVGDINSLSIGQPQDLKFQARVTDAYLRQEVTRSVWAIKHSPDEVTIFSPICTHLGCHYKWNPQSRHFECPCHGSVFTIDGKVIGGPAPRPLDTLPHKIENGKIYVEWERFQVGISEKVRV